MFKNRLEAGQELAGLLKKYKDTACVVYALPRGGVIVGAEIAKALNAPLDLIITRKIRHPSQSEFAIGAVAENGDYILNKEITSGINENYLKEEIEVQKHEAQRRRQVYLGAEKPISCKGKTAILVDDGIATGLTMKVAIQQLRKHFHPKNIIVAVPVAPAQIADEFRSNGVEFVAIDASADFLGAIGAYYEDFNPVEDKEIINIMKNFNIKP